MSDPGKAVFLSYASQDAEAAKRICDVLRQGGVEVWFDAEGGLEHGDEWDAKIRRQIKECVLFIAVISAHTQAREEGYFRIEWDLAAERARGIASGVAFILPVVVDDTREPDALVPDRFRAVQWTRIPGGVVPPAVLARFLKLWSHRTGVLKHKAGQADGGAPLADAREPVTGAGRRPTTSRTKYLLIAAAVLVFGAALYFTLQPRRSPEGGANKVAELQKPGQQVTAPAAASVQPSAARQLSDRARAMSFDKYDSTPDDFAAAEGMLKQALELDPNDAEIWAASSQLNKQYQGRGFDHSSARATAALSQAQRACKLNPDSIEAQYALGFAERGTDPAAAEQIMRKILARQPDHPGALFTMSNLAYRQGKADESLGYLERVAAQPKMAALAAYLKYLTYFSRARFAEADQAIRQSIAVQPSANSVAGLAMVLLTWKGDADGAARVFAEAPTTFRNEPRTVWMTALVQLCRRAPDEALNVLDRLPDEYIQDNWLAAPKAYYIGRAQALAGRPEAARAAWEAGLAIMQARLKTAPANAELHLMNGELLALLGRDDEALHEARTVNELFRGKKIPWFLSPARIYAGLGRADEALPLLAELCPPRAGDDPGWPLTPALLRLDPLWDKIRNDTRFQQLLTEAAATAERPTRDWPKDPELKRATGLLDGLETIPEDFRLAEEITQRVLDRNPTDPEAVTVMARVHSMWLLRGWDRSTARYQKAKAAAERAIQLAPEEPEAYTALAIHLYARGAEPQRALELAQRAVDLCPQESRFHRMRDNCLWVANVPAGSDFSGESYEQESEGLRKALASARRTVDLFPKNPLVRYELSRHYRDIGRWEDFERVNEEVLALAPLANAFVWKARARFGLHGDLPGMKAVLDQVPARVRGIERTVYAYFLYAAFTGRPADGLDALNSMTESWMIDFDYRGPKALLTAALLELGGKKELTRVQYTVALDELMRARTLNTEDTQTYINEAWIKHGLGRADEARAALRIFNESLTRPYVISPMSTWWFQAIPANLLMGERETALTLMREAATGVLSGRATIRSRLALDPRMAPFRDDPEITALLAEPEAKK